MKPDFRFFVKGQFILSAVFAVMLTACGGGSDTGEDTTYRGEVTIDLRSEPIVEWDQQSGKTSIVLQFVPRGADNIPLEPDQVSVEMHIDDRLVDVESILKSDADELAVNINYNLVLDASYSMLTDHNPPAFKAMLEAARNSVNTGINLWQDRAGSFNFTASWFDEMVFVGTNTNSRSWLASDIMSVPEPVAGKSTKLYSAVGFMSDRVSKDAGQPGYSERHHDVMVVFSDGGDNYSWFANDADPDSGKLSLTRSGASYTQYGFPAFTIDDAVAEIKSHPKLTVHVIGLGVNIDEKSLKALSEAGNGLYLQNPSSAQISSLFSRVTREFTTLQTQGANIPLRPGEYKFDLKVSNRAGTVSDTYTFNFTTGDKNAGVVESVPIEN